MAGGGWDPVPEAPHEVAGAIAPTPLLIVHGDADHYFPLHHVDLLRAAAPEADGVDRAGHGPRRERHHADLLDRIAGVAARADAVRGGDVVTSQSDAAAALGVASDAHPQLTGSAAAAVVIGAVLAWAARAGAVQLLVALAAVQVLLGFAWAAVLRPPGRTG